MLGVTQTKDDGGLDQSLVNGGEANGGFWNTAIPRFAGRLNRVGVGGKGI